MQCYHKPPNTKCTHLSPLIWIPQNLESTAHSLSMEEWVLGKKVRLGQAGTGRTHVNKNLLSSELSFLCKDTKRATYWACLEFNSLRTQIRCFYIFFNIGRIPALSFHLEETPESWRQSQWLLFKMAPSTQVPSCPSDSNTPQRLLFLFQGNGNRNDHLWPVGFLLESDGGGWRCSL